MTECPYWDTEAKNTQNQKQKTSFVAFMAVRPAAVRVQKHCFCWCSFRFVFMLWFGLLLYFMRLRFDFDFVVSGANITTANTTNAKTYKKTNRVKRLTECRWGTEATGEKNKSKTR